MNLKKIVALLLVLAMGLTVLAGCGGSKSSNTSAGSEKSAGTAVAGGDPEKITLPISKNKIELSYFAMPEAFIMTKMKGYADMTVYKEAEKRTNISIKWREESPTDPKPKMNLMFSTGETEDIIWDAFIATGGAKKLLDDKLVLELNTYIDKYAPNLKKLIKENPELLSQIATDEGKIYMFPEIRLDPVTRANSGFQLRKDWLDKLNLKVPTTIDEWYTVLKAIKEKDPNGNGKADEIPFISLARSKDSSSITNFAPGFGILDNFYVENGKIKFGPFEPAYKNYITTMAKWYKEGLIDPEFASMDAKSYNAKITGDIGGAYYGAMSGTLGSFLAAKKGTAFDLVAAPMLKAPDGKAYAAVGAYGKMAPHGAFIGSRNKHVVETVKWLDWHYSEEGGALFNWGVEGQAHKVENGKKVFTDLIYKNPDKLSLEEATARYAGGVLTQMNLVNDPEVFRQLKLSTPQQQNASKVWSASDVTKIMPDLFMSEVKTQENTNIITEVNTYIGEMYNKLVMGIEPMENYDKFTQKLKEMKIETALKNYQEAYDKRKK